ncbi:MAG: cardiolipin synthase [Caldilineaceae bacterium]
MSPVLDLPIPTLVIELFTIYAIVVSVFLILENRSPQSTFAWIFFFLLAPGVGLLIYLFVGRGWRAFSREDELTRQAIGDETQQRFTRYLTERAAILAEMEKREPVSYKRKLLRLMSKNANSVLTLHNRLELLQDARQKYPRLIADIEQAQHSIHMAYYIWEEDAFTNQLQDLLIRKVQAGVKVRILVDAQGANVSRKYMHAMREGGVEMYIYYNYLSPLKLHTIGYRNHRKIVVIDGNIGYMGGINMSQEHLDGGKFFGNWRDTHLRIEGEATRVLQGIFITSWYNTTAERLNADEYFPVPTPYAQDDIPIQLTTSGPDSQWAAIRQLYFLMITSAEKHLYIQSPFFIPDDSIAEALKAAALAGIDVRIMCTPRGKVYQLPYWAANTYFAEMAEAGVRIYLYQKGYFHPKTVNVDSVVCSVGTANMDIRSFSINYEVNAVIYDEAIARQLEEDFIHDIKDCVPFNLKAYEKRRVWLRLRDSIARLFSPLL